MKKPILLMLSILFMISISSCFHTEKYKATYNVHNCPGLYSNVYAVKWWGFYSEPSTNAIYLTDSVNFRIYLGVMGENERYGCQIKGDKLYIDKATTANSDDPVDYEHRIYSIKKLKMEYPFK